MRKSIIAAVVALAVAGLLAPAGAASVAPSNNKSWSIGVAGAKQWGAKDWTTKPWSTKTWSTKGWSGKAWSVPREAVSVGGAVVTR